MTLPFIRTESVQTPDQAVEAADRIGYPVVLKIASPDTASQYPDRGVRLGLRTPDEVGKAFQGLMDDSIDFPNGTDLSGLLLQPMIRQPDFQIGMGSRWIPDFGPVIWFAQGGPRPEIAADWSIGLPPLNRLLARRIMENARIYPFLLERCPAAVIVQLEELLIKLSHLVVDFAEFFKIDINPLLIKADRLWIADTRITVKQPERPAPLHLIVSPYPNQYKTIATLKTGERIFIRPIRPEDAPQLQELFEAMSPQSVYFRFLKPLPELSFDLLVRFTQIDYDREIALVAMGPADAPQKMLGVARLFGAPDADLAEFSVAVGRPVAGSGRWRRIAAPTHHHRQRTTDQETLGLGSSGKHGHDRTWPQARMENHRGQRRLSGGIVHGSDLIGPRRRNFAEKKKSIQACARTDFRIGLSIPFRPNHLIMNGFSSTRSSTDFFRWVGMI